MIAAWQASPARFREDANAEEDLVLGAYRDRVIVELAQNAADAASRAGVAGKLLIELDDDELRVANTGAPLDAAGVEAASTLRASAKRDGDVGVAAGTVGRFGVGFAAVLAVSDEPMIVSSSSAGVAAVAWSRARVLDELSSVVSLRDELARRGDAVPVLRLPYPGPQNARPPAGFDTQVVLPLKDRAAAELVRRLLDDVDAALLLMLPALREVELRFADQRRALHARSAGGGNVVVDGVSWHTYSSMGTIEPHLLRDRPVEERERPEYALTWAVPVDDHGQPLPLPAGVAAVVHAPTPTDEPLSLPALLIAPLPLDPGRRHVAPGPLRDYLLDRAADCYAELVRELPPAPAALSLVPTHVPGGVIDAELQARIVSRLRQVPLLVDVDGGRRRPDEVIALDDPSLAADERLAGVLGEAVPLLVPAAWMQRRFGAERAFAVLGVRRVGLEQVLDELAAVDRAPGWWRELYEALSRAALPTDMLAGLPVPLAAGGLARSPRGLVMPTTTDLGALGLRSIADEAAHPLLLRLGASDPDPAALLADDRVQAAIEHSYDADDPDEIATVVLQLVQAAGAQPGEYPALSELALRGDDGELYSAGELLLPGGSLASVVVDDSPFGVVADDVVERWGPAVLTAAGVLDTFALVRADDMVAAEHDLDGEQDYFDDVTAALPADEPAVLAELLAVRDLELVRDDAWPAALRLLAATPLRAAVVEPAIVTTPSARARVLPYTAWWLRSHHVVEGRVAESDPLLEGLYDVVDTELDDEFLAAAGALRSVEDADPDDLMQRLADPARAVTRAQVCALYARVEPREPPASLRAVRDGRLVVVAAQEAVIVDAPDLLPLLGNYGVVPASLSDAVRLADLLDLPLATELGGFAVLSTGEARGDHVVHERLLVADVDGTPQHVAWRLRDGELHVDAHMHEFGSGRGLAWRDGDWSRRHLETELLRSPELATLLQAEADLDGPG